MNRFASALAVGFLLAAPASAAPPPLPVAISINTETVDDPGGVNEALSKQAIAVVQGLISEGWFSQEASRIDIASRVECLRVEDFESCYRRAARTASAGGPVEVIVLVTPDASGRARMRCLGPAETDRDSQRQNITVDLAAAVDPDRAKGRADRNAAAGCIITAAAESGW